MAKKHTHRKPAARKPAARKNAPRKHAHGRRGNPASMQGAAGVVAAGIGMGLVAIGSQKLIAKVGAAPAPTTAVPSPAARLSPMAQGLLQTGVGVAGGLALSEAANMPRAGAAFAAANAAIGLRPAVVKVAPSIVAPAAGMAELPAGNRVAAHVSRAPQYGYANR